MAESTQAKREQPDNKQRIGAPELRALIEKMVRRKVPESEVDDLVQTVLCDALAAETLPDGDEPLRKWIAGITRHKVADYHRRGSRGKQVELPEQLAGEEAPLAAREWVEWAEKQTEGNEEEKKTLDWMAREGGGEKLAHIAEDEKLPATQVRQRVSRLRRTMKQRWAAELAAVAAIVILALIAWSVMREGPVTLPTPKPEEPRPPLEPPPDQIDPRLAEAEKLRADGLRLCDEGAWQRCLDALDDAKQLDPAGDSAPAVQQARAAAEDALDPKKSKERSDAPPPVTTPQTTKEGPNKLDEKLEEKKRSDKPEPPPPVKAPGPAPSSTAPPTTGPPTTGDPPSGLKGGKKVKSGTTELDDISSPK